MIGENYGDHQNCRHAPKNCCHHLDLPSVEDPGRVGYGAPRGDGRTSAGERV